MKRSESGMINKPITLTADKTISEALEIMSKYRISGIPLVMVFKKGKLIQKLLGGQSEKTFEQILQALQTPSA